MIWVDNPSLDAATSFALEWYLLRELDLGQDVFLLWRTTPTLMIGRFQLAEAEVNVAYAREKGVPIVRRVTGGGTIYTDLGGWQYSFLSRRDGAGIDFARYLAPIVKALRDMGVPAEAGGRNDILVEGRKVSGNAQYQSAGLTLHHGSLLFDTDLDEMVRLLTVGDDKLVTKGIRSVRQRVTNIAPYLPGIDGLRFRGELLSRLRTPAVQTYTLTDADHRRIEAIAREKFADWRWNEGQSPAYSLKKSRRCAGGKIEFGLNIKGGCIQACGISGDFFAAGDSSVLEAALVGCPYRSDDVASALTEAGVADILHDISLLQILDCLFGEESVGK